MKRKRGGTHNLSWGRTIMTTSVLNTKGVEVPMKERENVKITVPPEGDGEDGEAAQYDFHVGDFVGVAWKVCFFFCPAIL